MGYILALIGAIFTYRSEKVIKYLNLNSEKELIIKLFGLLVATVGCLIIMDVI
ncbi:MAG: hypothetical protein N2594_07245 [Clostridiales bacterium]|nr:hypothetical protein [Clostridiales bacterium]